LLFHKTLSTESRGGRDHEPKQRFELIHNARLRGLPLKSFSEQGILVPPNKMNRGVKSASKSVSDPERARNADWSTFLN